MIALELSALAIVLVFLGVRGFRDPERKTFLLRMALLSVASWIAENTVIRTYGFYLYDDRWSLFIDQVPLMIVLIWPVVIQSAWDLAGHLGATGRGRALIAAMFVLLDASLIEPVAVRANLWFWTEPGLFRVPPIGILGWAYFAFFAMVLLDRPRPVLVLLLAPVLTHVALLASWWTFFRWLNLRVVEAAAIVGAWVVGLWLAQWFYRRGVRRFVPLRDMFLRVPAALFFFVLLFQYGRHDPSLIAWVLAFVPPYLALVDGSALPGRTGTNRGVAGDPENTKKS